MKMKSKSLAIFFRRAGALLSSLLMICCLSVSVLAASETEADMPSKAEFFAHHGSWFVWRTRSIGNGSYYELCSSPIFFDSSGNLDVSLSADFAYSYKSPSYFDVPVIYGSDLRNYYACALPAPLAGASGHWSELPSFPVGSNALPNLSCYLSLYSTSSWHDSSYYVFLSPCFSSSPTSVTFSNTIGASSDSITASEFPSPLYSFPFAFRSGSSSSNSSYSVMGGDSSCINTTISDNFLLSFKTNKFLVKPETFSSYPPTYSCPSSELGLVAIKKVPVPSTGTINSASLFAPSNFYAIATLLVPAGFLPDVKIGDWLSDSPEDLQKALTNEFNVDSGTLKDSKQSFDSWQNSNTIDTDIADTSLDIVNAMMQNVGQFVAIVSLLCFGAVVLRVLIRKAVEG